MWGKNIHRILTDCLTLLFLHSDEKDNLIAGFMLEELTNGPQRFCEPSKEWTKMATESIFNNFKVIIKFERML